VFDVARLVGSADIGAATRADEIAQVGAKLSSGDHVHVEVVREDEVAESDEDESVLLLQPTFARRNARQLPVVEVRRRFQRVQEKVDERRCDKHDCWNNVDGGLLVKFCRFGGVPLTQLVYHHHVDEQDSHRNECAKHDVVDVVQNPVVGKINGA